MVAGAIQALGLLEQRRVVERRLFAGEVTNGKVKALLQQQALKIRGHGTDQFQAHGFVALAKTLDGLRQA
ncbi:hypothetical protein D3C72_1187730 [compost metagenome]